jgi:hypothetical protein
VVKYCFRCEIEHPIEEFYKNKHNKDGYDKMCKTQRKNLMNEYQKTNLEKNRKRSLDYYHRNKDKNKDRKRAYNKVYTKNRLAFDVTYKITCNLRKRLTSALKGNYKAGSAIKDLGCSIEEFKTYIESLWQPGMTWDNYGRGSGFWSLDHKKPLSSFTLENLDEFIKANHYTNLQPMWFTENCRKHKKLPK